MKIDERVEPLVREALDAAVKEDQDRLDAALKAFPDEETRHKGLELAVAITVAVLYDSHGGRPTTEQVGQAANALAEMSGWAGLSAEDAFSYLTTALDGRALTDAMEPGKAVLFSFVIAAGLLASSHKVGDNEWWFNYLDRIEAGIEAASS